MLQELFRKQFGSGGGDGASLGEILRGKDAGSKPTTDEDPFPDGLARMQPGIESGGLAFLAQV